MSDVLERIVLAARGARPDYAIALDAESFVVEGVPLLPNRRIALRAVYGLERAGAWLWIGAGVVPVVLGGIDVTAERLTQAEAALRARIGALPGGPGRVARLDARPALRPVRPWLTLALMGALVLAFAVAPGAAAGLRFTVHLLLLFSIGLVAEPWLGRLRVFASGGAALLVASVLPPSAAWLELAPLALALGLAGSLVFVRLRREHALSVRVRSALDGSVLLVLVLVAYGLVTVGGVALLAALAGCLVAPLVLRHWPEGSSPRLH